MAEEVNELHQKIAENRVTFENILVDLRSKKAESEERSRGVFINQMDAVEAIMKQCQEKEHFNSQVLKEHMDLLASFSTEERQF